MGWAAWKLKNFFLRFWVLLDLIRSEITIKHVCEAYKVHRMALEVSRVKSAWAEKSQFYLVIFYIFGCCIFLQRFATVPYLILVHITCLLDGRKEFRAVCMHIIEKLTFLWLSNTLYNSL